MASVVTGLQQIPGRHPGDRAMLPVYSLCHPLPGQKLCHSPHPSSHTGTAEFTSPHEPHVSASTKSQSLQCGVYHYISNFLVIMMNIEVSV